MTTFLPKAKRQGSSSEPYNLSKRRAKKVLIGFDGSRAFIKDKTGTENYSFQLLKALIKLDKVNQYIVYTRPDYSSRSEATRSKVLANRSNNNVRFVDVNWPRLWTQGGLAIQTFKDKLDVLFTPAHTLPIFRKPGLKTVITVHDLGSEYLPAMHQLKQRLYLGLMQKYQLQTATKIISVSKATKIDLINRIGIKPSKIQVVYEGYNEEITHFQVPIFKLKQKLNKYNLIYQKYLLFVGTIQPRKNLEIVIIAFSKTTIPYLVIVGSKGWLSDDIYQLPKKLGIEKRVKFLGYIKDEELVSLYQGALAFVFPSLFEGFGLPLLEAQVLSCPVLTSNISSMPEVANPPAGGGAILVDPLNVDDIVKGIEEILNPQKREDLIKKGLENVKRFSWEKAAKETLKILEGL